MKNFFSQSQYGAILFFAVMCTHLTYPQQQQQEQSFTFGDAVNAAVKYGPAAATLASTLFTPKETQTTETSQKSLWDMLFGDQATQQQTTQQPQAAEQTLANMLPALFGQPQEHQKAQTHAQTTLPKFFQQMAQRERPEKLSEEQLRELFNMSQRTTEQLFKSMGLPVPQLSDEQKEQMFQFSKKIFEQNKNLFTQPATQQAPQSDSGILKNLLAPVNQ